MWRYRQLLKDIGKYLWAQRYPAGVLLVLAGALAVPVRWPQDDPIRWTGVGLQIAGVLTVAEGIRRTRRDFGQRGLFGDALRNLLAVPRLPPRSVNARAEGQQLEAIIGLATGTTTATGTLTSSQQEQIDALRRDLSNLRQDVKAAKEKSERGLVETGRQLIEEREARIQGLEEQRRLVTNAQTGGLNLSVFGTVCILVGTLMGGLTPEAVKLGRYLSALFGG